jgi:hypothetical protein
MRHGGAPGGRTLTVGAHAIRQSLAAIQFIGGQEARVYADPGFFFDGIAVNGEGTAAGAFFSAFGFFASRLLFF